MTLQEKHLWYDFLRDYPIKWYRQRVIDRFIVDFYCSSARLVVELDGSQHYTKEGISYDTERTAMLNQYSLQVLRFSNLDIDRYFDSVCETIDNVVKQRMSDLETFRRKE